MDSQRDLGAPVDSGLLNVEESYAPHSRTLPAGAPPDCFNRYTISVWPEFKVPGDGAGRGVAVCR